MKSKEEGLILPVGDLLKVSQYWLRKRILFRAECFDR